MPIEDIVHIELSNGNILYSNKPKACDHCIKECVSKSEIVKCKTFNEKRRRGKTEGREGFVYFCSANKDLLKSSRTFKSEINGLARTTYKLREIRETISDQKKNDVRRLIHNLTSLNAKTIQEMYNIVPQDELTKGWKDQLEIIEKFLLANPQESSMAFLRVVKNIFAMKTEFSVFNLLIDGKQNVKKKPHNIRSVILNVYHTFFQDFNDKGLQLRIENNTTRLTIDYESFRVALYHILQNATKYCLNESTVNIKFRDKKDSFNIIIGMTSLLIEPAEMEKIFDENYSGYYAKKSGLDGDGIGMGTAKKLLELNNADLFVNRVKPEREINSDSLIYTQNEFTIKVNKEYLSETN